VVERKGIPDCQEMSPHGCTFSFHLVGTLGYVNEAKY
jgi:hypothetical protein